MNTSCPQGHSSPDHPPCGPEARGPPRQMGVPDPPNSCAAGQSVNDGGGASGEASVAPGDVGAGQRSDTVAGVLVAGATGRDATHAAMENMADVSWQTLFLQASPPAQPSRCSGAAAEFKFWVLPGPGGDDHPHVCGTVHLVALDRQDGGRRGRKVPGPIFGTADPPYTKHRASGAVSRVSSAWEGPGLRSCASIQSMK
jgi:hypothetical protein